MNVYYLYDADTGELIGPATPWQIDASYFAGPTGVIMINGDGRVIHSSKWAASQPTRRVYVTDGHV